MTLVVCAIVVTGYALSRPVVRLADNLGWL